MFEKRDDISIKKFSRYQPLCTLDEYYHVLGTVNLSGN